jgi:hypothetical protein
MMAGAGETSACRVVDVGEEAGAEAAGHLAYADVGGALACVALAYPIQSRHIAGREDMDTVSSMS